MNTNNKPSTAGRTTADDILQRDARFRYMLLARMQSDCEYYLDYGGRDPKRLWAGDEERQIDLMIKLHDSFKEGEKPQWLTMDKILEYKKEILKSATKLFSVLLASKRPLITELADKLRLKYPLLPTISPCPTMRLEAIRSIIPISCRRYPKSV